jgi:polyhydroxyalkanoate synthase subunit PhaC
MVDTIDELSDRRNEGVALNLAMGIDRDEVLNAAKELVQSLSTQPAVLLSIWQHFASESTAILMGFSTLDPSTDRRFTDPVWRENAFYKRVAQYYMAWGLALEDWVEKSDLETMNRKRARFLLGILKDLAAPVNSFHGNPQALRNLLDSRGQSLITSIKNIIDDQQHNHGYPAVADRNAFIIGKDVAASKGVVVYRDDLLELMQYEPLVEQTHAIPFLYVFSQVNRFYLGDLTLDRSLFQELLHAGIPVYAVSWRNPTVDNRNWNLQTYAEGIVECLSIVREISGAEKVNLMGLCAGGITTAAAAGLLQARGEDVINSHSLFVNILDNHPEDSDFGLFVTETSIAAQKARVQAKGIFDEKEVFEMFAWLTPEESVMAFFRDNYLLGKPPPVHPLLFWSMDYTRVPAGLQCDYLDLAWDNKLARKQLSIDGKAIDLSKITYDTYIMAGSTDHITPWRGCYRTTQLLGGQVEFVLTNQNHTQTISNKPNKHMKYWIAPRLPEDSEEWIQEAVVYQGSWREHWIDWLKQRSGALASPPAELGSSDYPPLDLAPGRYVLER